MTRLALIGYGRIAPKHLKVLRSLGCEIVAACNRSAAGRERAAGEGQIPRTYGAIAEMMERERPDGVVCCASVSGMFQAARELLPFGRPTLLEKPPGTSLAELGELIALADRHATPVMIGLNRRHYSVVRKAVEDAGGPEAITAVSVDWSEDPEHLLARGFSPEDVGRMIFGNSLHGLDLVTHLGGPLATPAVATRNHGGFRWLMALQGVSERGVLASFQSTWDAPARWRLRMFAAGRCYSFAPLEGCLVSERGQKAERAIEPDEVDRRFKPGFHGQAEVFLEGLAAGRMPAAHALASAAPAMQLAETLTAALAR